VALVWTNVVEARTTVSTIVEGIDIVMDWTVGEGYWDRDQSHEIDYRGSMGSFPNKSSTRRDRGIVRPLGIRPPGSEPSPSE
jgi:hypothetical protein